MRLLGCRFQDRIPMGIEIKSRELKKGARELADVLSMHAPQAREAADGEGDLPTYWNMEDWLAEYDSLFREAKRLCHRRAA
jgi:hypothetical protein